MVKECPVGLINDWSYEMVRLFNTCHAVSPSLGGPVIIPGPLPSPGGVYDQENAIMEAFGVIKEELVVMGGEKKKPEPGLPR
jgi:predicted ATP-dependent Lon-type protease